MTKTPELLASCLAGFLFATTGCGAAESPPNIEYTAVPVSTKLEVPGGEICGSQAVSTKQDVPVALLPGGEGWQKGTNLFLQVAASSEKFPYGLIFLHGSTEIVPDRPAPPPPRGFSCKGDETVPAEIGLVQQLLQDLGGGIAAFPQALPKFDETLNFDKDDKRCLSKESCSPPCCYSIPEVARWLPPISVHDECYVDPRAHTMEAWEPFFQEYTHRIKTIAQGFHDDRGIPLEKIYLLGFSEGAVMAQRALIALANDGIRIGGGIGFDGSDVQMIASKETFETLRPPHPDILYFLYSPEAPDRKVPAECIQKFPGINLQFYQPPGEERSPTHSTYIELVEPTRLWIQARNKEEARSEVQKAWGNAAGKITRASCPSTPAPPAPPCP